MGGPAGQSVYLRNIDTDFTQLINLDAQGTPILDPVLYGKQSLSFDGRFVLFGDQQGRLYLRDRLQQTTIIANQDPTGHMGLVESFRSGYFYEGNASLSSDGRSLAFTSRSPLFLSTQNLLEKVFISHLSNPLEVTPTQTLTPIATDLLTSTPTPEVTMTPTPTVTSTPTPESALTATASLEFTPSLTPSIQLLRNPGFEEDQNPADGVADFWGLRGGTGERRICEATIALSGVCAFAFRGGPNEDSRLQQRIDLAQATFQAGDVLTLTGFIQARGTPNFRVRVIVNYADGTADIGQVRINTPTSGYVSLPDLIVTLTQMIRFRSVC